MGKGYFVVMAIALLAMLACGASAECFMTRGESELLCEDVPGIGCSLPESNRLWDFYCAQDYGIEFALAEEAIPAQIFPVFVELA